MITNYKEESNVKIEFKNSNEGTIYYSLCGFLGDEGLSFNLNNKFQNTLDLAGSIFGMFQEGVTSVKTLVEGAGQTINKATAMISSEKAKELGAAIQKSTSTSNNYVSLFGNNNIILNAPYYWQGTDPIEFNISLFQIAQEEKEVMESYQRILEILSPNFGSNINNARGGQSRDIVGYGEGPGYAMIHFFPVNGSWAQDNNGTGTIVLGPCLCRSVTMDIKAPYSTSYMPIIGVYKFNMLSARLLDRSVIKQIFQGSNGPLFPLQPARNIQVSTNITPLSTNE